MVKINTIKGFGQTAGSDQRKAPRRRQAAGGARAPLDRHPAEHCRDFQAFRIPPGTPDRCHGRRARGAEKNCPGSRAGLLLPLLTPERRSEGQEGHEIDRRGSRGHECASRRPPTWHGQMRPFCFATGSAPSVDYIPGKWGLLVCCSGATSNRYKTPHERPLPLAPGGERTCASLPSFEPLGGLGRRPCLCRMK